ncbi:hypothetical protein KP509_10G007400 [Ceratopteris richardii]|nr:hypothetical protein KP509_10G007400 [Ceratopteris richardii]
MQNLADATWFLGKWIAVPALVILAVQDVLFTVASKNELWIPVGLLVGIIFSGIIKETFSSIGYNFQHSILPLHLLELGIFFVILKSCAFKINCIWFRVFLLHFTTGGLWQTFRFCLDWKWRKKQSTHQDPDALSA